MRGGSCSRYPPPPPPNPPGASYLLSAAAAAAAAAAGPPGWAGAGTAGPPGRRRRGRWLAGRGRRQQVSAGEATNKFYHLSRCIPPTDARLGGDLLAFFFCIFIITTLDSLYRAAGYLCGVIYVHVLNLYGNAASFPRPLCGNTLKEGAGGDQTPLLQNLMQKFHKSCFKRRPSYFLPATKWELPACGRVARLASACGEHIAINKCHSLWH